ncbi:formylglycine-generating enzyme family protein [Roseateles sp.]|uniref:formylglycine-generating enzyme family protein n=1 Tax=Roseateles sp. TaxID=1971397 RepID=UPI0039EBEC5B
MGVATALIGLAGAAYVALPAGTLNSVLARDTDREPTQVAAFKLRETPVTRAEFRRFLASHPEWKPGRAPAVFAGAGYLQHELDDASAPVTEVSWFAAQAYCEAEGGRLPTWYEWEYAAAADPTRIDARDDPAWLARILGWYARPASGPLPAVGGQANVYGVRDLHGLVWEWVDDFNALLVNADSRSAGDPDRLKFCGAGAIDLQDRRNYAVLMRIALLSSLSAADSTGSLGFRCAQEIPR